MTGCIGKIIDMHKEHAKLEELQRKASHDGLTGLLNHSHAEMIVREKLLEEKDRDYIIVIFDIDYFKNANDRCGHMFGDKFLKHIAERLQ